MRRDAVISGVLGVVGAVNLVARTPGFWAWVLLAMGGGSVGLFLLGKGLLEDRRSRTAAGLDESASRLASSVRAQVEREMSAYWRTGRVDLAETYRTTPTGRVMVLGGPGAGKTVLVQQLALDLLGGEHDRVPVVLPLASWDSRAVDLDDWMAEYLAEHHPRLRAGVARALIDADRVLPLLDGLDEMAPDRQQHALRVLESPRRRFVLTSRPEGFAALPAVKVVFLGPLSAPEITDHLVEAGADERWSAVLEQLSSEPDGALAKALATPVYLGLAVVAYADPRSAPVELLDPVRFGEPAAIRRFLQESALVRVVHVEPGAFMAERDRRAIRHLGFLADHLQRLETGDFAWWDLKRSVPLPVFGAVGLVVGLLAVAATTAVYGEVAVEIHTAVVGAITAMFALGGRSARSTDVRPDHQLARAATPIDSLRAGRRRMWAWASVSGGLVALVVLRTDGSEPAAAGVVGAVAAVVGAGFSTYFRYSLSRIWLAARGMLPLNLMSFLKAQRSVGLLRRSGAVFRFYNRPLQEHFADEYGPASLPRRMADLAAHDMVAGMREELVDLALAKAEVHAVVEAPRVETMRREVVGEIEGSQQDLVTATAGERERFVASKGRFAEQVRVPFAALGKRWYFVLTWALATLVVVNVFPVVMSNPVRVTMAFAVVVMRLSARVFLGRHRHYDRLRALLDAWAVSTVALIVAEGSSGLLVPSSTTVSIAFGIAAVVCAALWGWARPLKAQADALGSDDPRDWPTEQQLPRAAAARQEAARAHRELVDALVEKGVLPLVAARVEVLAERSYATALPEASVGRLGGLTERAQFVPTDTSAQLNRMLDAMSSGAIGLSGARGIGKSTVLQMFGDQRFSGKPGDLSLVVTAPTDYDSRDFLVHLFTRLCLLVLPPEPVSRAAVSRLPRLRWVLTASAGAGVVAGAVWWPQLVEAAKWVGGNARTVVAVAGGVVLAVPLGVGVVAFIRRRARLRGPDTALEDEARRHLRGLRYLETTTRTRTATLKPPGGLEAGNAVARQRAEQVKTYPELVAEFREFLGFVGLRLRSRADRADARVVVCVDEVDKIATAEAAEQFVNDLKSVFGVQGVFFLVAVSQDALTSFSRRVLSVRTTFDSAFDDVIQVSRLTLTQTRRLLVQRVLRLPEPFVWLCYALSGGLPRDLNRIVRQLYDARTELGPDRFERLALELIRQDLETTVHGQVQQIAGRTDEISGKSRRWLAEVARLPLTSDALAGHVEAAPSLPLPSEDLWQLQEQSSAYLRYAAVLLRSFCEGAAATVAALRDLPDHDNPLRHLADARTHLSVDAAMADAAVNAYQTAVPG
ncbi:NACHT domain-containing protein [Saccharothrix luteola]|uniref:NACHT domain-containing protein n=1 Tax=Saccharothrix luteola TaxID=2893018 RepID=UPI001E4C83DE|nr:NACHT domain-containing protein [Saccharothrix luteola]MCC8243199.1 NACHT domain-containing protein [Saccharothrix luteola]